MSILKFFAALAFLAVHGQQNTLIAQAETGAFFPKPKNGITYVIAHRGVHNGIPENSLPAYQKAIDLGCDFIEIDVRQTKDGRIVSIHNSSIDAYVKGATGKVSDFTLEELKAMDIGEGVGAEWENTRIPTIEEILQLCKGKIGIYLDLKEPLVPELVGIIKKYEMERDIVWYIPAYFMGAIKQVRNTCPECFPMPDPGPASNIAELIKEVQALVIATDMGQLSEEYMKIAHENNTRVFVDEDKGDEAEWNKILDLGTDGIQTDNPQALMEFLKTRGPACRRSAIDMPDRGICAHRGAMDTHPENTLAAFKEAVRLGAHMIELDVRMTQDAHLVILHDETVDRTTDGKGKISELTLEEVKQLDAGSWKSEEFTGERLPTFKEALAVMPANIWLNVHIKGGEKLGERVARIIVNENRLHQAFLACGSDAAHGAKEISSELMICNMERQNKRDEYIEETIRQKSQFIQLLAARTNQLLEADIALLKGHHIRINYCCTDSLEEVEYLFKSGVDFILTDKLSEMLEVAASEGIEPLHNGNKILENVSIVIGGDVSPDYQKMVAEVIISEVNKRTGFSWKLALKPLENENTITLSIDTSLSLKPEAFHLKIHKDRGNYTIGISSADKRGLFYGAGKFLRMLEWEAGSAHIPHEADITSSPEYAIRGHQFGYRNTANSWDSWTVEQFDQHFREQMFFGANSFENIPFQDPASSVHFKVNPQEMEIRLSEICDKYDADYWVWTPAPSDLTDGESHQEGLDQQEKFYAACPRLDAVFVPGGDPGDNHPSDLMPYLKDLSLILKKYHPDAGLWVSMQGFEREKAEYFLKYLEENDPDWLTGLVHGPGSPPVDLERQHLPEKYMLRLYPDITHSVRCQYPVKKWDQAFALTLGREGSNPQPLYYAEIFNRYARYSDGFLTYSDGTHDDLNKVLWSSLGWDPDNDVGKIVLEYCRFFFGSGLAEEASRGIFALEKNWVGPVRSNPVIGETLDLWKKLETENPRLSGNWRWQQLLMRAYYDAYIQERLDFELSLEEEAYRILARAESIGVEQAMDEALLHLQMAEKEPVGQDFKLKVIQYGEDMFESVGAQTSVPKYQASGYERGAVLDFIDYPLNNRWWLEDEFNKIRDLKSEEEILARLDFIMKYENPGEGSYYDNISSADARHVISETDDAIDYLWENDGFSRKRLSTQLFQFSPVLQYDELDPDADYLIRVSGYGEALLCANGLRLKPTKYEKGYEQFKEFPLPKELIKDGKLKITFDDPHEEHLNWRKQSRVTDVWIIKQ